MRFKTFKIVRSEDYNRIIIKDSEDLFSSLDQTPKLEEEDDEYAVMYLKKYYEYILGTMVQSYKKIFTKFENGVAKKKEVELEDNKVNDKTLFYINCNENTIYIQSKRYPEYLTEGIMRLRMEKTLSKCFNINVNLLPTEMNYTLEQIEEIYKTSYVKRIAFKNLYGLELPINVELHNPRKDLDDALIESYNVYSRDKLDTMEFKAKKGEKLGKNPFAMIGFVLARTYEDIEIFKDMDIKEYDENVKIKTKGNDGKIINISKKQQDNTYEAYDAILKNNIKDYKKD